MIRLNQIKLDIFSNKKKLKNIIASKLSISKEDILNYQIFKESIDARRKKIKFVYTIDVEVKNEEKILKKNKFKKSPNYEYKHVENKLNKDISPIIVGAGPAGLFAALILAENGYKPIILEQGEKVENRIKTIEKFWNEGILNEYSNVQFGEGGAGTFSDGKLTTRIKDIRCRKVLKTFIDCGAPEEIIYKNKPHIGTDYLRRMIIDLRNKIIKLGGKFYFNTPVSKLLINKGKIEGVLTEKGEKFENGPVILAIGHSSRKLFEDLHDQKVEIKSKPFAVGVRIEHLQKMINKNQYGNSMIQKKLGSAEYKLTYNENDRGVYSFCMCPGGEVVAASSEKGTIVTNGMSYYKRNRKNANSALLVTVKPKDFGSDHPLSGMYFQRSLEKRAFELGGGDYSAPATYLKDYLNIDDSKKLEKNIKASYRPDVKFVDFNELLPDFINLLLKNALKYFDKKIPGFSDPNVIMTGVETRSSSPIRILRDSGTLESVNIKNLYPCGEGAGYAGGIMSSAVDGIKVAEKVIKNKS